MPTWFAIYLVTFATLSVYWIYDDIRDKELVGFIVAELLADLCMTISALAYWFVPLRSVISPAIFLLFSMGPAWLLVSAARERKKLKGDPDLSTTGQSIAIVFGVAVSVAICSPMLFFGYKAVLLVHQIGT